MKSCVIEKNDSGQRLNKFIQKSFPSLPQSLMYKAIRKKNIKINKKRCYAKDILSVGDIVDIYIKDELLQKNSNQKKSEIFDKDLKIIYQDENMIIVDKPAGLKSQLDRPGEDNLIDRINGYLIKQGDYVPENEKSFRPALCNRLDRNTRGLVIAAKNFTALQNINMLINKRKILKIYSCFAEGNFRLDHEILVGWWTKDEKNRKAKITQFERNGAKKVITEYFVLEQFENKSKLKIILHTGRFHQIRAHLAHIGHPIIGDLKYGSSKRGGQQLVASGLIFKSRGSILDYMDGKIITL